MLTHRHEIVDSLLKDSSDLLKSGNYLKPRNETNKVKGHCFCALPAVPARKVKSTPSVLPPSGSGQSVRPTYGSQVVIQSAQEKQLKKFFRKEEKRMMKQAKEAQEANPEDHRAYLKTLGYDPEELRKER